MNPPDRSRDSMVPFRRLDLFIRLAPWLGVLALAAWTRWPSVALLVFAGGVRTHSPGRPFRWRACSRAFERRHPRGCDGRILRAHRPPPNLTGLRRLLGLPKRPSRRSTRRMPPAPAREGRRSGDPYWESGVWRDEYNRPRRIAGRPSGNGNDPRHDIRTSGRVPLCGMEYTAVSYPRS